MKRFRPYIIGAILGILALTAVPFSGLLNHRAGNGPDITRWYTWMAARQSVTMRSLTIVPPDLDDPAMVSRAAGHYEMVCTICHGSPAAPPARFAQDLTPRPPLLDRTTERWRPDARVFQTVKYGIRHTAMPAWPTGVRDDEVWDMVALMRHMPQMTPDEYRDLAGQAGSCRHCHGQNGQGRDGMPRLDTLSAAYIAASLRAYRDGSRASGPMIAVAKGLSDDQINQLATSFGTDDRVAIPTTTTDHPGAQLAMNGAPERDIPACLSCHQSGDPAIYPALIGQQATYLKRQLDLFTAEHPERGGPHAAMMNKAAHNLKPDDIDALVEWLSQNNP